MRIPILPDLSRGDILLSVILLIGVVIFSLPLRLVFEDTISVSIAGLLINFILTIFLIGLYSDIAEREKEQSEFAKRQTEIAERQQNLMEANHIPLLSYEDMDFSEDNELVLTVCNTGSGVAKNLKIRPRMFLAKTEKEDLDLNSSGVRSYQCTKIEPLNGYTGDFEVPVYPEETMGLTRITTPDIELNVKSEHQSTEQSAQPLPSGEKIRYATKIMVAIDSEYAYDAEGTVPTLNSIHHLSSLISKETEYHNLAFELQLIYSNILGEEMEPIPLIDGVLDVRQDDIDIETLLWMSDFTSTNISETSDGISVQVGETSEFHPIDQT